MRISSRIYLGTQHFIAMLCVALALHIIFGVSWAMLPKQQVTQIPVHVLNIKLGGGDANALKAGFADGESEAILRTTPVTAAIAATQQSAPRQNAVSKPAVDAPRPDATPVVDSVVKTKETPVTAPVKTQEALPDGQNAMSPHATPAQYVRANRDSVQSHGPKGGGAGSAYGNSVDSEAVMMERYTQLISTWINRQKAIMMQAVPQGMQGNVVIRLRIDRTGKIHMFKLDKGTGVPAVDAAAANMVRAANPVPPVPTNFPGGQMFEFLIPIRYSAQ